MRDALEDIIGGLGSYEGVGATVVGSAVFADALRELGSAALSAATTLPLGQGANSRAAWLSHKARGYGRFRTIRTVIFMIAGKLDFSRINPNVTA